MMNDDIFMLWLTTIDGLGIRKQRALLEHFESARDIFNAPAELLKTVGVLNDHLISTICNSRDRDKLYAYAESLEQRRIRFISITNGDYPELLKEIFDPPTGLYISGELPPSDMPWVSVIGSRRCSEYGLTMARSISKGLAKSGVVVVSGMARGIDSMAHKGALEGGGLTIAVLGCGVDVCYPPENRALREEIIKHGCVISEHPPGTQPLPAFFPMRNRIISGLSTATVVTEAAKKSGTLITVEQALEQGREVMAVPGNVTSKLSEGTNAMIKEGAALVSSYEDILDALGINTRDAENNLVHNENKNSSSLAPEEKLIYDIIGFESVAFDDIISGSRSQVPVVTYILTMLELRGYIQQLPGRRYIRLP